MEAEEEALAQIGIEVLRHFSELINAASQSQDESISRYQAQFHDELDRFQLFAANLGLIQNGHSSLDYRLRESDLLQLSIRRLLQDLIGSLEEASQFCMEKLIVESSSGSPDKPPESSSSAAENDQDEDELLEAGYGVGTDGDFLAIELIFESISDAIDRLFRLATEVRNPRNRQIAERVYTYKDVDEATGVNVIDEYAKFDRQHVLQLFGYQCEASPNEPGHYLVERLSQANVFRRQQFGYWQRRRTKLQHVPAPAVGKLSLPDDPTRLNLGPGAGETMKPVQALSRVATSRPYTASMLDPSKINVGDNKSTVSVSEYAPTARDLNNEAIDWPSPPSKLKGKKHFECPYCFILCSSGYLERKAWRAHLLRDLRPYICTYEHCADAKKLYDTRKEWAAHENSVHRQIWRCLEHAEMTFQNRAAYEDHLKLQHPQEAQLQSFQLMRAGESTTSLPDRPCPFCQAEFRSSSTLQDHIAFHLERIARFALPRSTGVDDESSSGEHGSADAAGSNDESQGNDLKLKSLGSFSGNSDTYKGRMKRETDGSSAQNRDIDTTTAQTGQRLDQNALKGLEAKTSGNGGVNVSEYLQLVDGHQSETTDSQSEHWTARVFQDITRTPLAATGETSRCYGESNPEAYIRLKEEFDEILEIAFGSGPSELVARLYHRESDHRARILCKWPCSSGGRNKYSCQPLNVLEFFRVESSLQICEKKPGTLKVKLWASFVFSTVETLVIFYCTLLSLRSHDSGKPVTKIQDYELAGETGIFAGQIIDDNYLHVLRIYRDRDSKAVRLQASVHNGEMKRTPIWTAFITHHLVSPIWLRSASPTLIYLRELRRHIFSSDYEPSRTVRGEHILKFTSTEDTKAFIRAIDDLNKANKVHPFPSPPPGRGVNSSDR